MTYQIHQRDAELRGIAIGEQRGMLEASKKMLQAGMTEQDVARIMGLSLEKVKSLTNKTAN